MKKKNVKKDFGFVRVAAVVPKVYIGNPTANVIEMFSLAADCIKKGVQVAVFPELCITGYTAADTFAQNKLLVDASEALDVYVQATRGFNLLSVVGMPLMLESKLFNVAVFIQKGKILAIVPKSFIPNYKEFYEARHFHSARDLQATTVEILDQTVPIGTDILVQAIDNPNFTVGVDICEDIWMPNPPSARHALHGATILVNLSASNAVVNKGDYRRMLVTSNSGRCIAAQIYVSAGPWESSSDTVFDGHSMIAVNGTMIKESKRFSFDSQIVVTDIDVEALVRERVLTGTFGDAASADRTPYRIVKFASDTLDVNTSFLREIDAHPFVPKDPATLDARCEEVFSIQTTGLIRRLQAVFKEKAPKVVIGISGGLDSTLVLLAAVRAYQKMGWDEKNILTVTMPGPGTTARTKENAIALCKALGTTLQEIPITDAVTQHLRDIGHEPCWDCLTCQNAQARERTQILMDLGFVLGTGDLSEAALGWCTYNADQYSMYNVNAGVPKTLVKYVVAWEAKRYSSKINGILMSIVGTPISPELTKPTHEGEIDQKTEDLIGPYELHDFFIFHMIRNGFTPEKIAFLAEKAFTGTYSRGTILHWLKVFYARFFSQQFKRNGGNDGLKVGTVSLSQRADWRMPSDMEGTIWIVEVDEMLKEIN